MAAQNLFGLEGLTDFGLRNSVDVRPTLLRVLTDLYVHRLAHTADEERHYTELALRLLEAVDVPTRIAVAKRLAGYRTAPARVLQWLTENVAGVAAELRAHSLLTGGVDPAVPHPAAMPAVEDATLRQGERFTDAPHVVDRTTASVLNELFFTANAQERRLILLNFDVVAPVPAGRVGVSFDPSVGRRLEAAALTGNNEEFAQLLARALRISREQARRMARDELGEPVAVAGKALGLARDVLHRILLFVNPAVGHSVERVHALAALYDAMTPQAAQGMVEIWQALPQNERAGAKHQPLTWDEVMRRGARAAAAAPRTAPAPRTNERRSAS
ncbi:MAG: DUF2336 domain-containing protein [Xanthobacteraceae bacterium]